MIAIKNVRKFFGKQAVLKGTDLTIQQGTVQALLGANGAGKSTLIYIFSGLLKADEGEIWLNNEQINMNDGKYRSKVGFVFDKPVYMDKLTAKEQLTFTAELYGIKPVEYKSRVTDLMEFFELPDNGTLIESYSKGMKSKVSLAMALINRPSVLVLDEPFDGIDFLSVQKVSTLFKDLAAKGVTILITSHQYDVIAEICEYFALLKDGVIVFNEKMSDLEHKAASFSDQKNPVKAYLESLMMDSSSVSKLSWLSN
jgi:ABC-2 type transport system ATP-binding protein